MIYPIDHLYLLPLCGADPDGDDDGDEEEEEEKPKPKPKAKPKRKVVEDDDDEDEEEISPEDAEKRRLSNEAARRRREKNAAERRALAAEAELEKIKNAEKSKEDRLTAELKKAQEHNDKLTSQMNRSALRSAIIDEDAFKWHDVSLVMKELDLDDLDIDLEEGTVDGLKAQLKALAKAKPFLVKGQDDEADDDQQSKGTPTGSNPRGNSKAPKVSQRDDIIKKYKVLQDR